jgi:hypothetical protein
MATKYKRSSRGLVAAALALFSAGALAGEITLFQNRDFRGDTVTLQSPVMNLERSGFQLLHRRSCARVCGKPARARISPAVACSFSPANTAT